MRKADGGRQSTPAVKAMLPDLLPVCHPLIMVNGSPELSQTETKNRHWSEGIRCR
jgi:hypothetical protein